MQVFTLHEASSASGVAKRTIRGWVEQGLLKPTFPGHGKGTRRGFTDRDILRIGILRELRRSDEITQATRDRMRRQNANG